MKITIITPWKQDRELAQLEDTYLKRLKSYTDFELKVVKGEKGDSRGALEKEGKRICDKIDKNAFVVALTEKGAVLDSIGFSRWLDKRRVSANHVVFVIGSASGVAQEVLDAAAMKLSLSAMTFPHKLARLVLVEQIYRAFTLINATPYHK